MRQAKTKDFDEIIRFLNFDVGNCVYIYIDIMKYGLDNDSPIKVWVCGSPICTVIMKYHDSFQLYGKINDADKSYIKDLLEKNNPRMLYGEKSIIQSVQMLLPSTNTYEMTYGSVFEFLSYRKCPADGIVSLSVSDMRSAAELMMLDESFASNYTVEDLAKQLSERNEEKSGRNYGIFQDNKLVGYIATFAESNGIAVTSGLIVHPEYRKKPYGMILESYLVNDLISENYKVFTFVHDPLRIKLLRAMKQKFIGEYAKLVLEP